MVVERKEKIIIVDDDSEMRRATRKILKSKGFRNFEEASQGEELIEKLKVFAADLILLDISMPGMGGEKALAWCKENYTDIPVVMITGRLESSLMLSCLKLGAYDYITKPFDNLRLITTAEKAIEHRMSNTDLLELQTQLYKEEPENNDPFSEILTSCSNMKRLFAYAESSAKSNRDILITGETGTGKDLLAQAIHRLSGRPGEYVAVNAAGLDDQLFADTLFGHVEGAFTGAQGKRKGLIELAKNGTLFLDEIGDLSIPSQVKLLRVLQEREYMPLGADRPVKTSARVVAATSVDLEEKMKEDLFRKDLFFRLRAHHLHLPALRQRRGDIKLLFDFFLEKCLEECNKNLKEPLALHNYALLEAYPFHGNIRELEAFVYDLVYRMKGEVITLLDIKSTLDLEKIEGGGIEAPIINLESEEPSSLPIKEEAIPEVSNNTNHVIFPQVLPTVDECTDQLIKEAIARNNGNKTKASEMIGMSRKGLINRVTKMNKNEELSD